MPGMAQNCLLLVGKMSTDVGVWKVNMRMVDTEQSSDGHISKRNGHDVVIP